MKQIILNPRAGKGRTRELFAPFAAAGAVQETQYPGHAIMLAREGAGDVVVSVGGDGTHAEVATGLLEASRACALCPVPAGSGNDLLLSFPGAPKLADYLAALKSEAAGDAPSGDAPSEEPAFAERAFDECVIDAGMLNGHVFLNVASAGFDAMVVHNARRFKKLPLLPAKLSYLFSVLYTLFSYRCRPMTIALAGARGDVSKKWLTGKKLLVAMANGQYYGGAMHIAPHAQNDDGLLDVYIIDKAGFFTVLRLLPTFIKGRHIYNKLVHHVRCTGVTVSLTGPTPLNYDGEELMAERAETAILPAAITVLIPKKSET